MPPKRGWTSQDLQVVESDDLSYWSTSDAAFLLGGGLKPEQVRSLIRLAGITPAGKRHGLSRRGGRYVRVYAAVDLIRAYDAISDVANDYGVPGAADEFAIGEAGEGSGDEREAEALDAGTGE